MVLVFGSFGGSLFSIKYTIIDSPRIAKSRIFASSFRISVSCTRGNSVPIMGVVLKFSYSFKLPDDLSGERRILGCGVSVALALISRSSAWSCVVIAGDIVMRVSGISCIDPK